MPSRADSRFDAFRLSASGGSIEGHLDPSAMPRLADQLAPGAGRIDWRIHYVDGTVIRAH